MEPILFWAEQQASSEISIERIQAAVKANNWQLGTDVQVLSGLVWGFLNSACSDKARVIFANAARMNGFDAWRRLCFPIDLESDSRIREFRDKSTALRASETSKLCSPAWTTGIRSYGA